jgi:hypothetical protein
VKYENWPIGKKNEGKVLFTFQPKGCRAQILKINSVPSSKCESNLHGTKKTYKIPLHELKSFI